MGRLRLKPPQRAPALVAAGCAAVSAGMWVALGLGLGLIVAGALAIAYGLLVDLDRGA